MLGGGNCPDLETPTEKSEAEMLEGRGGHVGEGEQGRAEVENTREAGDTSILPASSQL